MSIRVFLIGAATLVVSVSSAHAQQQTKKQVVIPKTVLKSMVANKPKSKSQLGAKAGIRRSKVVAVPPANAARTSVRELKKS
jgi:hypothetical protein